MNYITVGQILKPQGIKGEVKVNPLTDSAERFKKLRTVYIENRPYKITAVRVTGGYAYIKFDGVSDRNAAELLRNKMLEIDRVNSVTLNKYEFLIADMINARVISSKGELIGTVKSIDNYGAADVYTVISSDGKTVTFPFLKRLIMSFNEETKTLTLDENALSEVAMYED